jgi:hypothetical protein
MTQQIAAGQYNLYKGGQNLAFAFIALYPAFEINISGVFFSYKISHFYGLLLM